MNRIAPICLACCVFSSATAHTATVRTVALSGEQVSGAPDGTVFSSLSFSNTPAVLNAAGQTAFQAWDSIGFRLSVGIWSEGSGSLASLARYGQRTQQRFSDPQLQP